jgi:hypothetical protein
VRDVSERQKYPKEADLVVQTLDVLFDRVDELGLVLLDGSTDLQDMSLALK